MVSGFLFISFLGQVDGGKGNRATAAFPAEVSADVPKSETAVATVGNPVPSNTTDVSRTYYIVEDTTASDAQDKHANYAPTPPEAESTLRAPETALAEVGFGSRHSNDLDPGPTSALPLPPVTPCQPCLVPGGIPLQMSQPHIFLRRTPPEKGATMTKEHTPTPESAALVYAGPETPTPNVLDAKNAGESPKASPAAPQDSAKADGAVAEPTLRLSQHSEADGCGSSITKGGEPNLERPVIPTLRLDHIREVNTASTMTTSGSGAPIDGASSSWLEEENDSDVPGPKLSKAQKKRIRGKAMKQALMSKKSSPCPPLWETSNSLSVSNSDIQEPKPITTALVDVPVGKGGSVCVDAKTEGGKDYGWAIVEKSDAAATTAEAAAAHTAYGDQW